MTSDSVQSPPRLGQRFLLIEIQHVMQCTARWGATSRCVLVTDDVNFYYMPARLCAGLRPIELMRKFITLAALAATAVSAIAQTPQYVSREVLVKFKTSAVTLPAGATVKRYWKQIGWRTIKLPASMSVAQGITYYRRLANVQYVEPNYIRTPFRTVNDPMFGQQYAMTKIKANQAWDLGIGNPAVIVAVLDTGFEVSHTDMQGKFVAGFDFIDNDNDPTWSANPHGVETAGCVAAGTDNAKGIAAIGFNCRVMPLRVGDSGIPLDASISGMMYAADNGAKVINMSYGGPGVTQSEQDAVNYAWNKGLVVIASAGNTPNTNKNYPAACDNVISVAASDQNDAQADFTTFGDWVDVAAPGVQVLTTAPNNSYAPADGTSFSGPITAGLAGLLFAFAQPNTPNTTIRDAILNTCDPVGNWVINGRINAFKAMQLLAVQQAPAIEVDPVSIQTTYGTTIFGDVASVLNSDNIYYQIGSSPLGTVGQAAAAEMQFNIPADTSQISIKLETIGGIAGGTNNMWLWNWNTSQYDLIGSTPMVASGDSIKTINVPNINVGRYVGPGGSAFLLVRGHLPLKPLQYTVPSPFNYRIDQAKLLIRQSS